MKRLIIMASAMAVAACSGVRLRAPSAGGMGAIGPEPTRGVGRATVGGPAAAAVETQRFCRSSMPGGWIAVDYSADSGCVFNGRNAEGHPVALAVHFDKLPVGTELEVCAAEHTPSGWDILSFPDNDGRCPSDGATPDPNQRTLKRIRRSR